VSKWSAPPAEPPAKEILAGSALNSSTSCSSVRNLELAGTTMTSGSLVREAIGVTFERFVGALFCSMAPTITSPMTISWLGSPARLEASRLRPMVPPAPGTL
jgi:hypothetical protein